jgi:hypothetical protein
MSEEPKPRKRGCLARLVSAFLLLISIGLATALYFASQSQDLSDIKGYGMAANPAGRDLSQAVAEAVQRGGYEVKISEADLNGWLKRTFELKQGGLLADQVKLEGIAVRLENEQAEVILERSVFGRPMTASMFLRIEKIEDSGGVLTQIHLDGGPYTDSFPKLKKGGRIGKLVVPQGFLILLRPSFEKVGRLLSKEAENGIQNMNRVTIEKGSLILDPRDAMERNALSPDGTTF